jgi:hypothetical protein
VIRAWLTRAAERVDAFWFAPTDPATLALVRVAFGALAALWTLSLAADLGAFYSPEGLLGSSTAGHADGEWSLLWLGGSHTAVAALYLALLLASVAVMVGWHTRLAAATVFVAMTSLARANPFVLNSGDTLIRLLAFYLVLAPAGNEFSLDRRRALRQGRAALGMHAAWPLRLIQLQVSLMYAAAVWSKLQSPSWRDGSAVSYATRLPDLVRFPAPSVLDSPVATYTTVAIEAGLVVLVWNRRTRAAALAAGVLLHLGIDATIRVGFFSLAVFTAYLSFANPLWVREKATEAASLARRVRNPRAARADGTRGLSGRA